MIRRSFRVAGVFLVFAALSLQTHCVRAAESAPKTYVSLWFDTEDFILPESDDAALKSPIGSAKRKSARRLKSWARRPACSKREDAPT